MYGRSARVVCLPKWVFGKDVRTKGWRKSGQKEMGMKDKTKQSGATTCFCIPVFLFSCYYYFNFVALCLLFCFISWAVGTWRHISCLFVGLFVYCYICVFYYWFVSLFDNFPPLLIDLRIYWFLTMFRYFDACVWFVTAVDFDFFDHREIRIHIPCRLYLERMDINNSLVSFRMSFSPVLRVISMTPTCETRQTDHTSEGKHIYG